MSTAPLTHHKLGPSSWPAWAMCPAYTAEQDPVELDFFDDAESPTSTDYKGRGTLCHEVLAAIVGYSQAAPDLAAPLSSSEKDAVVWAATAIQQACVREGFETAALRTEERMEVLGPDLVTPLYFGTCDAHVVGAPLLFDAKFGQVRDCFAQLCGYALAKMDAEGHSSVKAIAVYGRARRCIEHVITRATAEAVAYGILAKREAHVKAYRPNEYCGWCALRATCPAISAHVADATPEQCALTLNRATAGLVPADPVEIGRALWVSRYYLGPWIEAVDEAAKALAATGGSPLGFKATPTAGRKSVSSAKAAWDALRSFGCTDEQAWAAMSASIPHIVEALCAATGAPEKDAKAQINAALEQAGALRQGAGFITLRALPDGEQQILAAIAQPVKEVDHV